jgi:hypothetical protein
MYDLNESPECYRLREAQARELALEARSHNIRQIHLSLADEYKSLAEQAGDPRSVLESGR